MYLLGSAANRMIVGDQTTGRTDTLSRCAIITEGFVPSIGVTYEIVLLVERLWNVTEGLRPEDVSRHRVYAQDQI